MRRTLFVAAALALVAGPAAAQTTPTDSLRADLANAFRAAAESLAPRAAQPPAPVDTLPTPAPVDTLPTPPADTVPPIVIDTVLPLPDPDTVSTPRWDLVLADTAILGDVYVPAGERWLIGRDVQIAGNLRTDSGTIALRPGSYLRFIGADPGLYIGGGRRFEERFANDVGLWVGPGGVLDIQGTPKVGMSREGMHSTWSTTDEMWIAPTGPDTTVVTRYSSRIQQQTSPRRWFPGDSVPQIHELAPAAEVFNVTRDITIEGPGHIHISSSLPQRLEYFTLRNMGIARPDQGKQGLTTSRYALHFHMVGEGSRGTIIRGVASIDARGRVFVPHGSHGITMVDNVAVNSFAEVVWWDLDGPWDRTNDIHIEELHVTGVHFPTDFSGASSQVDGIALMGGLNMTMRNSSVSGVRGSAISNGFHWVGQADDHGPPVWNFDRGNVAHNNQGSGLRFWNNNQMPHETYDVITYRNGAGVENGAYANANYFEGMTLIEDALFAQASGRGLLDRGSAGRPQTFKNVRAPRLVIGHIRLAPGMWQQYTDCQFDRVLLNGNQRARWQAVFEDCNVTPEMVEWPSPMLPALEGSWVRFITDGTETARIDVRGGVPIITRP